MSTTGKRTTGKGVCKDDNLLHEYNRKIYGVFSGGDVHKNITTNPGVDFENLPATPDDAKETHVKCEEESKVTAVVCHEEEVVRVVVNLEKVV